MSLRSAQRFGLAVGVLVAGLLALPSSGAAQEAPSIQQFGVEKATSAAFTTSHGRDIASHGNFVEHAFIATPGPPPRIVKFIRREGEGWEENGVIGLPDGTEPFRMSFDDEGLLHVVDADGKRELVIDVQDFPPSITETKPLPGDTPVDLSFGFFDPILLAFEAARYAVLYGPGFETEVEQPPVSDPPDWNAVDQYPGAGRTFEIRSRPRGSASDRAEAAPARSRSIRSMFVLLDAHNNRLWGVSDTTTPRFVSSAPGPPGGERERYFADLAVSPLNYNRSFYGAGNHPIVVSVPQARNVYVLRDGTWRALSSNPFGAAPQGVAASCTSVAVTDSAAGKVTFFNFAQPKGTVCEETVNVALSGKRVSSPKVVVKPYGNYSATVRLGFKRKGKTKARKTRLKAGRIKTVKLKFSRRATRRITRALRRHRSLKGTLTLRLKNKAGEKVTVKRRVRIRRR